MKIFIFLVVKFSVFLYRSVFEMNQLMWLLFIHLLMKCTFDVLQIDFIFIIRKKERSSDEVSEWVSLTSGIKLTSVSSNDVQLLITVQLFKETK